MNRLQRFFFTPLLLLLFMVPGNAQDPASGLDSPLVWTVNGSPAWKTVQSSAALAGGDVARASQAGDSSMEAIVTGPAVISFSWRLLGPDGKGWLSLEIDDHEMATLRRAIPWQRVEINLPPGDHILRLSARGMARIPGSAAEADNFTVHPGAQLPWISNIGDDPSALWVVTGSGTVTAEAMPNLWFDDGNVAAIRGTERGGRTSMVRLVQGPARLAPRVNVKGGSFAARDLDSAGPIRRVNSAVGNTWNDDPLIIGPGLHRVEWVHFYWAQMEVEKDPYPQTPPASLTTTAADVATLASLAITPLTLNDTLGSGLTWTSTGTNPFVPTLADREPNSLNHKQLAALAVERPGPGQDARLSTVIHGPAEVTLRAVCTGPEGDSLRILADGEVKFESHDTGNTGSQTFEIPAGPVTVEIEWISGFATDGWPRKAALTAVEVRYPLPADAMAALDAPAGLTFFTTHPENWDSPTADPRPGLAARTRLMPMTSLAFPEFSAWVDGPSVLTYWRRAELPAGSSLLFPGVLNSHDPGPFTWQAVTVPVPDGRHRLVWYSPSPGQGFFPASANYDLDGFSLVPGTGASAIPLADALDTPGRTWTSSGNDVTAGNFAQQSLDGVDSASLLPADQITPAWVETSVTGPAIISVHFSQSTLNPTVNGVHPPSGTTSTGVAGSLWTRSEFAVPPGEHLVRFIGYDPGHPLMLDMVEITTLPVLSLNDALDAPVLTITSGGDRWQPLHTAETADGDALFAAGQGSGWVEAEVTGPARVSFDWKAGPEYTRLALELNGAEIAVADLYQPWQSVTLEIPTGTHSLRWTYTSPDQRPGAAALNQLSVEPLTGLTLGDALDAPSQTWFTSGPPPQWTAQTELSHDGVDAAYVPTLEDESTLGGSALQTSVTGPAKVHFWWRKDGPGMVHFRMDGRNIASLAEENAWQESTVVVPPGRHIFQWSTFKNHYFERRAAIWVDDFRVEAVPVITLGEALNAPGLPWRTSPDSPWEIAWRSLPEGGEEPAVISAATPGESTWIETDVTGPAVLSFLYLDDSYGFSQGNLLIDGEPVIPLRGASWPADAVPVRFPIPAGTHTLRWQWDVGNSSPLGSAALERLMIDRVEIATGRPTLESLFPENSGLTQTGSHPWTVQAAPGGGFRAESNPIAPGSQSGIQLTVPGNRELAFRTGWAGLRSNRLGGNFLMAHGRWLAIHGQSGYVADEMQSVWHLPAGADHTLRWTTASANGVIDAMFLDQLSLDTPVFPIGESLGIPQKTFLSTGGGRWYGQTTATHSEGPAVSSTGSGSLITEFTGPGTVRWWWKSEGAPANASAIVIAWPYGQPGVYATGNGNFDWKREEVLLPWGETFRLEWRAFGSGEGRLLIDDVSFRESATDSYTVWAIQKLIGGNRATMDADPDGDGQPNLMEFAFGSDPNSHRSAYTQDLRITDGEIRLCLTHPDHDTTGLNYDLEFSTDLRVWTRLQRIPGGPSLPDQPITCAVPTEAEGDRGFVRIRLGFAAEQ